MTADHGRLGRILIPTFLAIVISSMAADTARAGGGLDIKNWLSSPGVRILAVEFYATWCKPCMEAVPKWKRLHEKYRDRGLRLVVVSVMDPDGACVNPGWNPDDIICDTEGDIAEAMNVGMNLPAAFLWSWRGNLLVRGGHVDQVEKAVDKELAGLPRVTLDDKMDDTVRAYVRSQLAQSDKLMVPADDEERKALSKIRRKSHELGFSDATQCRIGEELAANSLLKARFVPPRTKKMLILQLFSAEKGCMTTSAAVYYNADRPHVSVAEAVSKLVGSLRVPLEMPTGGVSIDTGTVRHGVDLDRGDTIRNEITDETGFLVIETEPADATLYLNGKEIGTAPKQLEQMVGRYVVTAEKGALYHTARQEVDLTTRGAEVKLELRPAFGALEVFSEPAGANVWLDGEKVGVTPYKKARKPSGSYSLRVKRKNYLTYKGDVRVEDGKTTRERIKLDKNFGALTVKSEPSGVSIELDGRNTGRTTPHTFDVLEPGVHTVRISKAGYGTAVERPTVERNTTRQVDIELQAKQGLLSIMASYDDGSLCRGKVYVDGREMGITPLKLELLAIEHDIRVVCEDGERSERVSIVHNQKRSLNWEIRRRGSRRTLRSEVHVRKEEPEKGPKSLEDRNFFLGLGVTEGMVVHEGDVYRSHVGLELSFRHAFDWFHLELASLVTVEEPIMFLVRPGGRFWFSGFFIRTALQVMAVPEATAGVLLGLGYEFDLGKGWSMTLGIDVSLWPTGIEAVPIEGEIGGFHAW